MADLQKPFGKYYLSDKLGTGGMAEIYKAKTFGSDGFEKTVVIKKILPHWANDPEFIRMLVDEAKLAVILDHPNIVDVMDLGSVDNTYYIAMAFVDGFDLKTLMNRADEKKEKIPVEVACYIIMQTAAGLEYAHRKIGPDGKPLQIIHRDVSPHNILLSYNGDVKISDFGIAKAASKGSFTATGMLKGKFSYMSPEQTRGENLTHQSDIFPLGVVLYEMLTGKKCFDGDTALAILEKIRHSNLRPEDLPESIPNPLRQILAKSMAGNLQDRYASAEAFQVDLAHFLAQQYPGFLQKDLAKYLKAFKKEEPAAPSEPTIKKIDQNLPPENVDTSISYITGQAALPKPALAPVATAKKSTPAWLWILIIFFFFFGFASVGAYFVWAKILQPKFAGPSAPPPVVAVPTPPPTPPIAPPVAATPPTDTLTPPSTPPSVNPSDAPSLQPTAQVPSTQPAGAADKGSVELKSTPPGASILVDKSDTGLKTPATLPNLPLYVSHSIGLQLEGYETWEKSVTLVQNTPLALDATLAKVEFGQAFVASNPPGAQIFLNDQDTGLVTPANVNQLPLNKPSRIRLAKNGYLPVEAVYTPVNSTVQPMDIPMKAIPTAKPKRRTNSGESGQPLRQYAPPSSGNNNGIWVN